MPKRVSQLTDKPHNFWYPKHQWGTWTIPKTKIQLGKYFSIQISSTYFAKIPLYLHLLFVPTLWIFFNYWNPSLSHIPQGPKRQCFKHRQPLKASQYNVFNAKFRSCPSNQPKDFYGASAKQVTRFDKLNSVYTSCSSVKGQYNII